MAPINNIGLGSSKQNPTGICSPRDDLTRLHCTLILRPSKNPFILLIPQLGKLCNTVETIESKNSFEILSYFGTSSRKVL